MVLGKQVRLSKITAGGKMLCIPMDHGMSVGPVRGLDTIHATSQQVQEGGATAILVHKGIIRSFPQPLKIGMIMHASASTNIGPAPNRKMQVATVEEAVRLGADAVSVHINIGSKEEPEMLEYSGQLADNCDEWQVPFITMMYPRGENIRNPNDPEIVAHVARIGAELGADVVKTVYTGDPESFRRVVRGCPVPIVIAGGPKAESDRDVLEMAHGAMQAGAIGVTFGRNVFQHPNPRGMVAALAKIIFDGVSTDTALSSLG